MWVSGEMVDGSKMEHIIVMDGFWVMLFGSKFVVIKQE